MRERRQNPRTRVFKGAKVILSGRSTVTCIVRDLSSGGACLQLPSTTDLPAEFRLSFDTGNNLRKCRVVWRTLTNLGVSFELPAER